jgi:bacteriocin-like protein
MFKNLFNSKKENTTNLKVEKLDKNQLKNVIGGGDPVPGLDVNLEQHPGGITATPTAGTGTAAPTGLKH